MIEIINKIKKEFAEYWDLGISGESEGYRKTTFDALSAMLILDHLLDPDSPRRGLAIVMPENEAVTPLTIVQSLLAVFMHDVLVSEKDSLKYLKKGDQVILINKEQSKTQKGLFECVEERNGRKYYAIQIKDVRYLIPEDRKSRIRPLQSKSQKGKKRNAIDLPGKSLENAFQLKTGEAVSLMQSKMIVVTNQKQELKSKLRSLVIEEESFEEIFPIGNYTTADKFDEVGRNPLGRSPICCLTSGIDIAADIDSQDQGVKLVLVDGGRMIANGLGSLDRFFQARKEGAMIVLLSSTNEEALQMLLAREWQCWIWSKEDFRRESVEKIDKGSEGWLSDFSKSKNYWSRHIETETIIENCENLNKAFEKAKKTIFEATRSLVVTPETGVFLARCHAVLKECTQLPVPLSEYEESAKRHGSLGIAGRIASLEEELKKETGYSIPSQYVTTFHHFLQAMSELFGCLEKENPKYAILSCELEKHTEETIVICGSKMQRLALADYFGNLGHVSISESSRLNTYPVKRAVFTGWFGRRPWHNTIWLPSDESVHLLYQFEKDSRNRAISSSITGPFSTKDSELRMKYLGKKLSELHIKEERGIMDAEELFMSVMSSMLSTPQGIGEENGHVESKLAVSMVFSDGSYAFLPVDGKVDRLDKETMEIQSQGVSELMHGDTLVFAEGTRELFEDILNKARTSSAYTVLAQTASMWWKCLKAYSENTNLGTDELQKRLARYGCKRTQGTIQNWMDGKVISPWGGETLATIAEIIGSQQLKSQLPEVTEACNRIHSLHIKTGHLLSKMILDAAEKTEAEVVDDELYAELKKYAERAHVVTIESLSKDAIDIPLHMLGFFHDQPKL